MNVLGIVVNYGTPEDALGAAESLLDAAVPEGASLRVSIVDNASPDDSVSWLEREIARRAGGARVRLLSSHENGGFGAGNNLAVRCALASQPPPDFFLLLNPDARLDAGALGTLLDEARRHPTAGILGPRIVDERGRQQVSAFHFPSAMGELEAGLRLGVASRLLRRYAVAGVMPERTGPAEWVSGAAMLIRREVFEEVGLFDEGFFLYFEETDLCHRARRCGLSTRYVHEATAAHRGGGSTARNEVDPVPDYWFASRRRYFLKNRGSAALWLANGLFIGGYCTWRVRRHLQRKTDRDPPHFLRDFLRHARVGVISAPRAP